MVLKNTRVLSAILRLKIKDKLRLTETSNIICLKTVGAGAKVWSQWQLLAWNELDLNEPNFKWSPAKDWNTILLDEFPGNGKDTNFMKNEQQKD